MIWKESRLQWREPNFGRYPLSLDGPPDPARFSEILHKVGNAARDANRVEVPFEFIAPKPDQYWTFDSSKGVDIPLGRAGATKLQHLKLGKGTSQHVLTAGKTGSGKSTMLHALITNGALQVQPGPARALPDRLQERRRVQGLRRDGAAARAGHRRRERTRIRPERAAAAGR